MKSRDVFAPQENTCSLDARQCWKDLEKSAKCPLCSETLEDPKTLPCLYSFCLACLDNLVEIEQRNRRKIERRHRDKISCPICQTSVQIPDENTFSGLPTLFHLERFKDILAVMNENQEAKRCTRCDERNTAISYCFVCNVYLCVACDRKHRHVRDPRGHRKRLLQRNVEIEDLLQRPVMCTEWRHDKKIVNLYCQQCHECICQICHEECHRSHYVDDIHKAARRGKKELNEAIMKAEEEITACEDEMEENTSILESRKEEIRAARRNVTEIVRKLIKSLEKHKKAMLTELDELDKQYQKRHATDQEKLKQFVARLNSPVEHGKGIMRRNIDVEIVKEKQVIIDRCEDLLNSNKTEAMCDLPLVNYVTDEELCERVRLSCPGQLIVSKTNPSQTEARGKGLTNPVVGEETDILVRTNDSGRKWCYHEDDQVKVVIESPSGEELKTKFEDKSNGKYKVTFTPKIDGTHDVMITVNGQPLTGSPWSVQVSPHLYRKFWPRLEGYFRSPCGIAISKHKYEEIAVADRFNKSVHIFSLKGKLLKQFGNIPDDTKNLRSPYSVEYAKSGEIIVVEENGTMTICSREGIFVNYVILKDRGKPCSVSVKNDGQLVVCDCANAQVKIFDCFVCYNLGVRTCFNYSMVRSFAGDQESDGPPSYAIHHEDRFFVSYQKKHCVKVFNEDGDFLYNIGASQNSKELLISPLGLAIDKFNNLIICDTDGCRLQVFTLEGRYVTTIEGFGSPQFVAVSKDGRLFVTDEGKKCVHVLI